MTADNFIINTIACDWLTLTSFDIRNKRRWLTVLRASSTISGTDIKRRGYVGIQFRDGYLVQGEQEGRTHTMMVSSGASADEICYKAIRSTTNDYRCTRVDIQLTVPMPESYSARVLADYLKTAQRKKVMLVENGGLDTVYVGSRQSTVFWRIYVKWSDVEMRHYLRFEIEVKPGRSNEATVVMNHVKARGRPALVAYFFHRISELNLPESISRVINSYRPDVIETAPLPRVVNEQGARTYKWLMEIVGPAVIRFAQSAHGRDMIMVNWLYALADDITRRMEGD